MVTGAASMGLAIAGGGGATLAVFCSNLAAVGDGFLAIGATAAAFSLAATGAGGLVTVWGGLGSLMVIFGLGGARGLAGLVTVGSLGACWGVTLALVRCLALRLVAEGGRSFIRGASLGAVADGRPLGGVLTNSRDWGMPSGGG